MSSPHFIVFHRDAAWQYTYRGSIRAPFSSREEAVAAAIDAARETGDPDVEVIVQNPETVEETVWSGSSGTATA